MGHGVADVNDDREGGPPMTKRPFWTNKAALRGLLALVIISVFVWKGGLPGTSDRHALPEPSSQILFATPADSTVACFRIPAIEQINGVLLAAIDERVPSCQDLRGNRDINILLRRSVDGGATWMAPERVIDYADGVAASDPSFIVDREQGRIFLLANVMNHDSAPGQYRFHVLHSDDAGASWSEPRDITDETTPSSWRDDFMFVTSGRGTQAADGTLLHTVVNLERGVHVLASTDHGITWKLAETPLLPGDESKIVEWPDGTWMVNSRVAGAGHRWIHTSDDRGVTWQSRPDSALVDPAVNASLIRSGERLIYAGAHHATRRENLTLRTSDDRGASWSDGLVLEAGSAAYVSMTMIEDELVGVFYERADYTENAFSLVHLSSR